MIPFLPPGKPQFEVDRFLDFAFSKMDITQEEFMSTGEELESRGTDRQVFDQLKPFFKKTYTAEMKAHFFRVLQEKTGIDVAVLGKQEKYLRIRQLIVTSFSLLSDLYATLWGVSVFGNPSSRYLGHNTPREILFRAACPSRKMHEELPSFYNRFLSKVKEAFDKSELVVGSSGETETAVIQNLVNYFTQVVRQQFCHQEFFTPQYVYILAINQKYIRENKKEPIEKVCEKLEECEKECRRIIQKKLLIKLEIIFSTIALYKSCGVIEDIEKIL